MSVSFFYLTPFKPHKPAQKKNKSYVTPQLQPTSNILLTQNKCNRNSRPTKPYVLAKSSNAHKPQTRKSS